jgi:phage shock protein E
MKLTHRFIVCCLLFMAMFSQHLMADGIVWIDVRSAEEFAQAHVAQAINIPFEEIAEGVKVLGLDHDQTIYLYCGSGRRAGIAWEDLQGLGFSNISNVGGLEGAQHLFTSVSGADPGL